jgi:hypothetical protein
MRPTFRARLAPGGVLQFGQKQKSGDGGGGGQGDEEDVDECVHAREQNTGGRTSVGGGPEK